ncbi:hypothetical protein V8B97DRAFT_2026206 [Scleroderma yunnanense]
MAMLDNLAVEDQQSTYVQQQPEVLFHQLCMLFGFLIMSLLTESTLYWLNHIWTPIPSNKRALLLGCINSWTNEVKVNDSDGTPPNTLTSNSLTSRTANPPFSAMPFSMTKATTVSSAASGVAAAGKVTLMYDEDKGNAQPSTIIQSQTYCLHSKRIGTSQQLSIWHSNYASTAIAIIAHFLSLKYKPVKGETNDKDTDERKSPWEICDDLLTGLAFLFKDLEVKPENTF